MPTFFHTTDAAEAILRDGFRDATGSYLFVGLTLTGVFLSDVPVDSNEGARGSQLLAVDLPEDVDLADFEIVDESGENVYREWCVPASLLNSTSNVHLLDEDAADAAWLRRHV